MSGVGYRVNTRAEEHTCWAADWFDGSLAPNECKGCDVAVEHPCLYCGYGHVFTTHNAEVHWENEDPTLMGVDWEAITDEWSNNPHVYEPTQDEENEAIASIRRETEEECWPGNAQL